MRSAGLKLKFSSVTATNPLQWSMDPENWLRTVDFSPKGAIGSSFLYRCTTNLYSPGTGRHNWLPSTRYSLAELLLRQFIRSMLILCRGAFKESKAASAHPIFASIMSCGCRFLLPATWEELQQDHQLLMPLIDCGILDFWSRYNPVDVTETHKVQLVKESMSRLPYNVRHSYGVSTIQGLGIGVCFIVSPGATLTAWLASLDVI